MTQFAFVSFSQECCILSKLKRHVFVLASDSLAGREAGSKSSQKAIQYIVNNCKRADLQPWNDSSYLQPFTNKAKVYQNIVGVFYGNDSLLKHDYILVGAHYDHLGTRRFGKDTIYNGADDNASGVAVLLELMRLISQHKDSLQRSVIFAFFDAEEKGLYGSDYLSKSDFVPVEHIKLMLSVDMVGYLGTSHFLKYVGVSTINNADSLFASLTWNDEWGTIKLKPYENSILTATDTRGFAMKQCPTLQVTTGMSSPYHKVTDEATAIDYEGLTRVGNHLFELIVACASSNTYQPSGKVAYIHQPLQRNEFSINLINGGSNLNYFGEESQWNDKSDFGIGLSFRRYLDRKMNLALNFQCGLERLAYRTNSNSIVDAYYKTYSLSVPLSIEYYLLNRQLFTTVGAFGRVGFANQSSYTEQNKFKPFDFGWQLGWGCCLSNMFRLSFVAYFGLCDVSYEVPKVRTSGTRLILEIRF